MVFISDEWIYLILCKMNITADGTNHAPQDAFLSRLMETGATERSSIDNCPNQIDEDRDTAPEETKKIIWNIVAAVENLWGTKDGLHVALLSKLQEAGKSFNGKC